MEIGYSVDSGFLMLVGFCFRSRLPIGAHFLHLGPWNGTAYHRFVDRFGQRNCRLTSRREGDAYRRVPHGNILLLHFPC